MKNFRFLSRLPKNKEFGFSPRYYNAEKEELDKRVKAAIAEARAESGETTNGHDSERIIFNFREQIKMGDKFNDAAIMRKSRPRIQHQKNMSTVRFLVILNILLILTLYIFIKVL